MRKFLIIFVALILVSANAWGQMPELVFPLPIGETWIVTRAYNALPTHVGSDQYALDFAQYDCAAWDKPIYAAAPGIVEIMPVNAYGLNLYIDHGNQYKTHYAHLNSIEVSDGAEVDYGTIIGRCGNTGNVVGSGCNDHPERRGTHLHFKLLHDGLPKKPEPLSGFTGFPNGEPGTAYIVPPHDFSIIGHFSDGWHDDGTSAAFVQKYDDLVAEGSPLGDPWDNGGSAYVHPVSNFQLQQDFLESPDQDNGFTMPWTTITYFDDPWNYRVPRLLKEGFWATYMDPDEEEGGYGWISLGVPVTNELPADGNGKVKQRFWRLGDNYVNDPSDREIRYLEWDPASSTITPLDANSNPMTWVQLIIEDGSSHNKASITTSVDGVYHSGMWIAGLGQSFDLIDQQDYSGFYAIISGEMFAIDLFTMNGGMTITVGTDFTNAPVANFSATPTSGNSPLTVQFTDLSTNNPIVWHWDFGDGGTSTSQNPAHIYHSGGNYTVTLTASNSGGSDTYTRTSYVHVYSFAPVANFSASPTFGSAPLTVQFDDLSTNNPNDWFWNFGDGNTSTSQVPSHTYTTAGTYTVTLTASNSGGNDSETKINYITVTDGLVVDFVANVTSGSPPLSVQFTNQSSGDFFSFYWYFGDGNTSADQNPSHTYRVAGNYTVTLNASGGGESGSEVKSNYITVTGANPVDFTVVRDTVGTCDCVAFTSQVDVPVDAYHWDFGDGTTSSRRNPGHTYPTQGSYDVTLTINNSDGSFSETKENYIVVGECLVEMSVDVTSGETPLAVNFTGISPGTATFWAWDFGDDSDFVFEQNPIHIYQEPGVYTVQMSVLYENDSALIVRENLITVTGDSPPPPEGGFEADVVSGPVPLHVQFTNNEPGDPIIWFWDFGDGGHAMSKQASHTYTSAGVYSVTLYALYGYRTDILTYDDYISVGMGRSANVTKLGSNYPNPFNPSTTINFSLDKAQSVSVAIYDVSGRRVVQLANQVFESGFHSLEWLGRNQSGQTVSAGIYFVQMRTEKGVESKKITLLK